MRTIYIPQAVYESEEDYGNLFALIDHWRRSGAPVPPLPVVLRVCGQDVTVSVPGGVKESCETHERWAAVAIAAQLSMRFGVTFDLVPEAPRTADSLSCGCLPASDVEELTPGPKTLTNGRGLYTKFVAVRTHESPRHQDCEYFVLDVSHDSYALPALEAYMNACKETEPLLANDLFSVVHASARSTPGDVFRRLRERGGV